jgi:phosphonate degradation associated HDIG domain protein
VIAASVEDICALYETWGAEHYDEELSQLAHALQTAALAEQAGSADALVVAALLHDVGHLLEVQATRRSEPASGVDRRHETTGARYLSGLFGAEVTGPITLHVAAKRYLCAIDAAYHDTLSEGSRRSLERQGGPMAPDEVAAFEQEPGFEDAVALRRWDDLGKVDGLAVASLDCHRARLRRVSSA